MGNLLSLNPFGKICITFFPSLSAMNMAIEFHPTTISDLAISLNKSSFLEIEQIDLYFFMIFSEFSIFFLG